MPDEHKQRVRQLLDVAEGGVSSQYAQACAATAQVHAILAVAEAIEELTRTVRATWPSPVGGRR